MSTTDTISFPTRKKQPTPYTNIRQNGAPTESQLTCRVPCIITEKDSINNSLNTNQLSPLRETTQYPPSPRANMTLEVIYVTRHGVRCFAIFPISISHFPIFPHGQNVHPTKPAASHLVDQPCFYS